MASALVGACEEVVFAAERDGPHGALDDIVVDFDASVIEIAGQTRPARQRVTDRLGDGRFAGDGGELGLVSRLHRFEDRLHAGGCRALTCGLSALRPRISRSTA